VRNLFKLSSTKIPTETVTTKAVTALSSNWWWAFFRQTRSRILLLYLLLMLMITAAAVPVFQWMLFRSIDSRVREDLRGEMASFQDEYSAWESLPDQTTTDLKRFIDQFLDEELPEDDNFFIALVDGQLYRSSPAILIELFQPDSDLINRWSALTEPTTGERDTTDPKIGKVLYLVQPLMVDGRIRGIFVAAHTSAGEVSEALDGIYIFAVVAIGVVLFSFVLAWLATGRLLNPIRKLASTAKAIVSESDLNQRIPGGAGSGELAELTDVFNEMMARIQASFESQRNFINDAGHELRTPITIIRGHLELMGDDPEEQQETIDLVMDELDRMNRFVNDLILLAKAERTDFLRAEAIDVRDFMEDLYVKATTLADRKWHLVSRCPEKLMGDRQRLMGAMLNLALNATQHSQSDDLIELGAVSDRDTVRFWVRDTGAGISIADQKRIFDRFARAANSYRRSEGVGLGLAIVKAITEAHNGQIELISQIGAGSTFTLVIPLTQPAEVSPSYEPHSDH
jgi:signal transduction histidine kinase